MLTWLYDLLMTFVTFVMSFFGVELGKKNVTFASDVKEDEKKEDVATPKAEDVAPSSDAPVAVAE
jgi:hypothetical protein